MNSMFRRILQPSGMRKTISTSTLRNICSTLSLRDKGTTTKKEDTIKANDNITDQSDKKDLSKLVKSNKVVVFMKGDPKTPRCGFSNAVVQILRMHGVRYDAHDVLKNDELRQGIKEFSDWPTIPQVYINGQFVGGCDILLQMHQNGDLVKQLKQVGIESTLKKTAEEIAKPQNDK